MAGQQFLTPKSVKPSLPRKHFTLSEANKALPLVRRIVQDIVRTHDQALEFQAGLEKLQGDDQRPVQSRLDSTMQHLQTYVDELTHLGVELKDYETGLVDFIGRHQSRDVYLCWKLGEEHIEFWHEMNTGASGRKPVSTLQESESA